jgi:RNA polymerase sigma factor (sigma-70 family)
MSTESKRQFVAGLAKSHGRKLRQYLAVRIRSAAVDVPDLMQEVYLRLLRLDNHEAIRNPQAYLYTVASHVLRQHGLRQVATGAVPDVADEAEEISSLENDPASEVEVDERYERIGERLKQASPRAYATLVLHRWHGVPLAAISQRFGVSYSMTKKYLATALNYIESQLEEERKSL